MNKWDNKIHMCVYISQLSEVISKVNMMATDILYHNEECLTEKNALQDASDILQIVRASLLGRISNTNT